MDFHPDWWVTVAFGTPGSSFSPEAGIPEKSGKFSIEDIQYTVIETS